MVNSPIWIHFIGRKRPIPFYAKWSQRWYIWFVVIHLISGYIGDPKIKSLLDNPCDLKTELAQMLANVLSRTPPSSASFFDAKSWSLDLLEAFFLTGFNRELPESSMRSGRSWESDPRRLRWLEKTMDGFCSPSLNDKTTRDESPVR